MADHPNMTRMVEMRDMWNRGDLAGFLDRCSDDIVARVGGTSPLAGTYRGKQAYVGYLARLAEATGSDTEVVFHDVLAGERRGALVLQARSRRPRDGAVLDMKMAFAITFDDQGRWKEVWYLPADQARWDDFLG